MILKKQVSNLKFFQGGVPENTRRWLLVHSAWGNFVGRNQYRHSLPVCHIGGCRDRKLSSESLSRHCKHIFERSNSKLKPAAKFLEAWISFWPKWKTATDDSSGVALDAVPAAIRAAGDAELRGQGEGSIATLQHTSHEHPSRAWWWRQPRDRSTPHVECQGVG